ncbi:MAG: hypothetical protein P8I51_04475 [Polaribacter sp.]|jgi:hypothetical protein|nr:hypothetical protein [Polaribacter sp.]MDG1954135.1 hypothetical protein [Polaribacter sp.]MDG2074680.1 hypothetical protein [Polaribacter sp.]
MKNLLEKEIELMKPTLKNEVSLILKNDFETKCGSLIYKVLGVNIGEILVDTHNSAFRENIVIRKIKMKARVKMNQENGSFKESTISLKLNNDIHLIFNKNKNEYKIIKSNPIKILDINPN